MNIDEILANMTLEEKAAQLGSVPVEWLLDENGNLSEDKANKYINNGIGQITRLAGGSALTPEKAVIVGNQIQKFLVEKTRLSIPAMIHEECLSGYLAKGTTCFPQAIGMASTWEPELINKMTDIIRGQLRAMGAHQGLAPVLDVVRDQRWGRCEETFGEDPYLVARMAVSYVKGLQGDDLKTGIVATLKHFAGHSDSEGGRNLAPVHIGKREFNDVFLFPFEAGVKEAKAGSVMNAYHDIDGVPCAASKELLTDILREKWGFDGIIVSDYGAIDMLRRFHFVAEDKMHAAKLSLEAGLDIELPSFDCYGQPLINGIKQGLIDEGILDVSVRRILRMKEKVGVFENNAVDIQKASTIADNKEYRELAREMAGKSIVMLKNDDILPLDKEEKSIAVIGPNADSFRNIYGDYAYTAHLNTDEPSVPTVTVLDGIKRKMGPGAKILYAQGCDLSDMSKSGFPDAIAAAQKADYVIMVMGEKSGFAKGCISGEGNDTDELGLPGVQRDLIEEILKTGKPVILVLINGRPLALEWESKNVQAILEAWYPGEECGNALADVIFGDVNPSGKLPVSFPKNVGQIPINYSLKNSSIKNYVFSEFKPLYPFGHGLSYTKFEYENLMIRPVKEPHEGFEISFDIKNTGTVPGDEIAQLYVRDVVASIARPLKELKGFKRITAAPDETKKIVFTLFTEQLAFTGMNYDLIVEPGKYEVMIGSSSEDIRLTGSFEIKQDVKVIADRKIFFSNVEVR